MVVAFCVFGWILLTCCIFSYYPFIGKDREVKTYCGISTCNKIIGYGVPILIISLLIGLRYNVGVDYPAYKDIYEYNISSDLKWSLEYSGSEPLFTIICVLLHKLDIPYYGMFFVMTVIPLCFYYNSFSGKERLLIPATFFLYATGVFFWYMNIMRQGISFFILLFSIRYIIKGNFGKYLVMVLLASGFHISAFLFIPLYLFRYIKTPIVGRKMALVLYIVTWAFSSTLVQLFLLCIRPLLTDKYMRYLNIIDSWEMSVGTGLGILSLHIVDIMLLILGPLCVHLFAQKRFDIYYNIFFVGVLIANVAGLNMILSRIPFCLVSMRLMVAAFIAYYVYEKWKFISVLYRISFLICLFCSLANFIGNIISLDYSFVSL